MSTKKVQEQTEAVQADKPAKGDEKTFSRRCPGSKARIEGIAPERMVPAEKEGAKPTQARDVTCPECQKHYEVARLFHSTKGAKCDPWAEIPTHRAPVVKGKDE